MGNVLCIFCRMTLSKISQVISAFELIIYKNVPEMIQSLL